MNSTLRFLAALAVVAAVAVVPVASAGIAETIRLAPKGGSGVTGKATVVSPGDRAAAAVTIRVRGLAPKAPVRVVLNAIERGRVGASIAVILSARADARGALTASGRVRYRGQPVTFATIADGAHAISVIAGGRVVARGVVPGID